MHLLIYLLNGSYYHHVLDTDKQWLAKPMEKPWLLWSFGAGKRMQTANNVKINKPDNVIMWEVLCFNPLNVAYVMLSDLLIAFPFNVSLRITVKLIWVLSQNIPQTRQFCLSLGQCCWVRCFYIILEYFRDNSNMGLQDSLYNLTRFFLSLQFYDWTVNYQS